MARSGDKRLGKEKDMALFQVPFNTLKFSAWRLVFNAGGKIWFLGIQ